MTKETGTNPVTFEVIRNRLVAITDEMRIALQSVSGSPTVTEASDFFTGLFLPDGAVASMGFQVSFQAPVSQTVISHILGKPELKVRDGDMFIGNDPFIGALHQNDVQMIGPIYADGELIAWASVQAHQTDVGGMDFASWCPKAKDIYQEGMRIPCVKLVDQGELREDVLEMITTASRLPDALGLEIRAFIATINVARDRVLDLVRRYDAGVVKQVMQRMIESSEARLRARLRELPDGIYRACDFLEHDGHNNVLYKVDCKLTKRGDHLTFDFSGTSPQAPGFINATRAGLRGAVYGTVLPGLAYDIQWNQGALNMVEITAPDGLLCTAQFPAPVGAATVEAIWVCCNAATLALNKMLATSSKYRHRAQAVSAGAMATFNLGGRNQYNETFGLHLMDPLAAGSGSFASRDGVDAGGPITSPLSSIADVERNEQVSPLFYFYRRLACDTGGAGKFRGGVACEVGLTLGGIDDAHALVMTHGAEVPNSAGLSGGWPGATVRQSMAYGAVGDYRLSPSVVPEVFGPKPGLMPMRNRDLFAVSWQGGGGWGDPLERSPQLVERDVARGLVSAAVARQIYGAVINGGEVDADATAQLRDAVRKERVGGKFLSDSKRFTRSKPFGALTESLFLTRDERGVHVTSKAGCILSTNSTAWRAGAIAVTTKQPPKEQHIQLHDELVVTRFYCPASGSLLAIDFHEATSEVVEDMLLDIASAERLAAAVESSPRT